MSSKAVEPGGRGFRTIRGRLLFWVLLVTIPIYAAALYKSYEAAAGRLEAGAVRDADELVARLASSLDTVIRPIEGGIRTVAHQLEEVDPPRDQYALRIHGILAAWPDVYGSTIAVDVDQRDPQSRPFAPYYFRRDGKIAFSDLAPESYAYRELPWYQRAADTRLPVWSLPYFDAGGGETWMVTYSAPFFRKSAGRRVLAGVVTADLDLAWVRDAAERVTLAHAGVGWLASPPGAQSFVAPIGDTAKRMSAHPGESDEVRLRAFAERMVSERRTFALLPDGLAHEPVYLSVRMLDTLDWRLMLAIPQRALLAEARQLLISQLWLGAAGLLLLIAAIFFVAAGVSRPIHKLAVAVDSAKEGNLEFELPGTTTRDETGVLTAALRRLRDSLKRHVELRAESLAAQTRLGHELQIAAQIQQSMLPHGAAALVPSGTLVAGALIPAKQVGGDFYDYFVLRDGRLLFAVGDVSDKGVPAALFMARLTGLLRVLGNLGTPPDRLMADLNDRLADGNDACMFATLGIGVLNPGTGRLQYASAGHEPPLVRRSDGGVESLEVENGPAVGIDARVEYRLAESYLAPGDTLVVYTDGVTEAEAGGGAQLGIVRLQDLLSHGSADPQSLVQRIATVATQYAAEAPAADDLTVLAVALRPESVVTSNDATGQHWRISPAPTPDGIQQAQRWLRAALIARAVAPERIADAELITEEVLTNIVRSNAARAGSLHISVECTLGLRDMALTFRDDGQPFDPLSRPAPRLEAHIAERDIGGLGIHLVQQLAARADYSFVDGCNVLAIRLGLKPAQQGATA
ncbi:MAG TPA: SpoIIE family protein phosphatase [Steroidobacteraceae bacterium]|nr:SpoIIE family protein phosphatase [Steroidobacteraceae bacterium]